MIEPHGLLRLALRRDVKKKIWHMVDARFRKNKFDFIDLK
jgi:hypothetical protein